LESIVTTAFFDMSFGCGFIAGCACGEASAAIAHPLRRNAEAKTFTIILAADLRRRNISSLIAILIFSAGRLGYLAHARARKLQQMLSGHHSESHATRPSDIVLPPN
jgi:hypothetical protein